MLTDEQKKLLNNLMETLDEDQKKGLLAYFEGVSSASENTEIEIPSNPKMAGKITSTAKDKVHDIVIIGSGLGGLLCGAILSKNGYDVCILEKTPVIGGCLQTYKKDGAFFETGVHYIGGLDKGQNLYQIFSYIGLMSRLKLERLDMDRFDVISFGDNPKEYSYSQTYEKFIETLAADFPNERKGIELYCEKIKSTCERFPLHNLQNGDFMKNLDMFEVNAHDVINECVSDTLLQSVLAGNNSLYAGVSEKTPFYIHALIIDSYINSAWRCVGGGMQIAKGLIEIIKENGGSILPNTEIRKIITQNGIVTHVVTDKNVEYRAKCFISDLHPSTTILMTQTDVFRKAYIHRIANIENTSGAFILNLAFKPNSFPLMNYNFYCYSTANVWDGVNYKANEWPPGFGFFPHSGKNKSTDSASIITYLKYSEVTRWENTFNTVYKKASRGADYEEFKNEKAEVLLQFVEKKFPDIRSAIRASHTVTPLTYRDYIGTPDGSLYGIMRDCREPLKTFIPARTKIPNLLFTGQNLNIHGILGVSVSSLITCGELIGIEPLLQNIRNA